MMLNVSGFGMLGADPGLVLPTGAPLGPWSYPYRPPDFEALDAYVAAEVSALRALGVTPTATKNWTTYAEFHGEPAVTSYSWKIGLAEFPGYVREETVARYKDYSGGDPARAAQGFLNGAPMPGSSNVVVDTGRMVEDAARSQAATTSTSSTQSHVETPGTTQTKTPSNVIDSIINDVKSSELVSSTSLSSIPTWGWIAVAAGAAWLFFGRGK